MSGPFSEPAVITKRRYVELDVTTGEVACPGCGMVFEPPQDVEKAVCHALNDECSKTARA